MARHTDSVYQSGSESRASPKHNSPVFIRLARQVGGADGSFTGTTGQLSAAGPRRAFRRMGTGRGPLSSSEEMLSRGLCLGATAQQPDNPGTQGSEKYDGGGLGGGTVSGNGGSRVVNGQIVYTDRRRPVRKRERRRSGYVGRVRTATDNKLLWRLLGCMVANAVWRVVIPARWRCAYVVEHLAEISAEREVRQVRTQTSAFAQCWDTFHPGRSRNRNSRCR